MRMTVTPARTVRGANVPECEKSGLERRGGGEGRHVVQAEQDHTRGI